jgi:hypothetical protein
MDIIWEEENIADGTFVPEKCRRQTKKSSRGRSLELFNHKKFTISVLCRYAMPQ